MFLIQVLLPLADNNGVRFEQAMFDEVHHHLAMRFGGITAYTRAPVHGAWQEQGAQLVHDDLVIYEVMADDLDRGWWRSYRAELEQRFRQEQLIVRAGDHPALSGADQRVRGSAIPLGSGRVKAGVQLLHSERSRFCLHWSSPHRNAWV
ncbi:hypothetical protein GGR75_001876 [Xanthomonas campestris]|uniref:hypothetical protein n=1 Tax=Xanthomonas campestris TaxID=339 RepID=UPI002E025F94|nr:hypothetical protein [Xanthomonas campestris]